MIVRELLAIFGLDYDGKGQRQAERGIARLTQQANMLQNVFATALQATAVAAPFVLLTKLASDAQENLNLLQVVFKESAGDVVEWSNQVAGEVGRSKYTLRELASEFGGLVGAMVGPGEQAARMSMQLSRLAVDLSSLRNISEQESLRVLQSALAGETEAIKRFGVDLTVAAQEAESLRLGFGKYQTLTKEQKAQVRYNILMRDLAFVAGDAANTMYQLANSGRAFRDQLKDIGTEIGFFLLPQIEEFLADLRGIGGQQAKNAEAFRQWAADTNLAKAALLGVGLIVGALLIPVLAKVAPLLLVFAAFALIMDDVITTFEGGNSVFGTFSQWLDKLDSGLPGVGSKILKYLFVPLNLLRDVLGAAGSLVAALFESISTGSFTPLKAAIAAIGDTVSANVAGLVQEPAKILDALAGSAKQTITDAIGAVGGLSLDDARNVAVGIARLHGQGLGAAQAVTSGIVQTGQDIAAGHGLGTAVTNMTNNFEISQRAGESGEDFAQRVADIVDAKAEERDLALAHQLTQGAVP